MQSRSETAGLPREMLESILQRTPFAVQQGIQILSYGAGAVEISLPIAADHKQHHGFVHGAVIGFLADSACAWAAASVCGDVVTAGYHLDLFRPAVSGELVAVGKVISASTRQAVCRAEVYLAAGDGRTLIAAAQATLARV